MMLMKKAVEAKTQSELALMRQAGAAVGDILVLLSKKVGPGVTTGELDRIARAEIKARGVKSAFLGYHGFPGVICLSVNSEVVHGIPSDKKTLAEGDIIGLDFGVIVDGWYGDSAVTVGVGKISAEAQRLIQVTRESLEKGIAAVASARAWATSARPCRRTPRPPATPSCASSSATASAARCTRSRPSRTTARPARGRA
jgi:methionyl aminopeptidase